MAFARNPSYLKRQKEQQRAARAARKREERFARKQAKADNPDSEFGTLEDLGAMPGSESEEGAGESPEDGDSDEAN